MRTVLCLVLFLFVNVGWAAPGISDVRIEISDGAILGVWSGLPNETTVSPEGDRVTGVWRWRRSSPYGYTGARCVLYPNSSIVASGLYFSAKVPDSNWQLWHECESVDGRPGDWWRKKTVDAPEITITVPIPNFGPCNDQLGCLRTATVRGATHHGAMSTAPAFTVKITWRVPPDVVVSALSLSPGTLSYTGYEWAETELTATHNIGTSGGPAEIDITSKEPLLLRIASGGGYISHNLDAGVKKTIATKTASGNISTWKLGFRFPDGSLKPGPTRSFPVTITYRYL